jgi:hypothetical protein
MLKNTVEGVWSGLMWLKIGKVVDCCDHGNIVAGFVKFRYILDSLRNY